METKIYTKIEKDGIRFSYKKYGCYFFVLVMYDDTIEGKRVANDGLTRVQIYGDERLEWLKRRDEVLERITKARKLYNEIHGIRKQLKEAVKEFKKGLDVGENLGAELFYAVNYIDIDSSDLGNVLSNIPYRILNEMDKKQ